MNTSTTRRHFLHLLGLGAAAGSLSLAGALPQKKQNILFIAVDDLRTQLGCYGHKETLSPNIDKIAKAGTLFEKAYCQVPVCGATRASLMTSIRPTAKRFVTYFTEVDKDAPGALTLPQHLRENGYHTISNGKVFHHLKDTDKRSWTETAWDPKTGGLDTLDPESKKFKSEKGRGPVYEMPDVPDNAYPDGQVADKAISDLQRLAKMDAPFFLACGFIKPHLPFYAPKKYWDLYDREKIGVADNQYRPKDSPAALKGSSEHFAYHFRGLEYNSPEWHKTARHGYYACVSYIDAQIGRVMAELDRLGLRDDTIVILWGDHGWHLGEHTFWSKHNLLDNATNVPLMISAPGMKGDQKSPALVEFVDIYPTLCDLTGVPVPDHVEGTSAVPLLKEPRRPWKSAVFSRYMQGDTITTQRYAYTEYSQTGKKARMLYDHKTDPDENENISEKPENAALVGQLSARLKAGWKAALPK